MPFTIHKVEKLQQWSIRAAGKGNQPKAGNREGGITSLGEQPPSQVYWSKMCCLVTEANSVHENDRPAIILKQSKQIMSMGEAENVLGSRHCQELFMHCLPYGCRPGSYQSSKYADGLCSELTLQLCFSPLFFREIL